MLIFTWSPSSSWDSWQAICSYIESDKSDYNFNIYLLKSFIIQSKEITLDSGHPINTIRYLGILEEDIMQTVKYKFSN